MFAASNSSSDSDLSDGSDNESDDVVWSYVQSMIDADTVNKPSKRLRTKTPDMFTMAPLEVPQWPPRRTSEVLAEHMGLGGRGA